MSPNQRRPDATNIKAPNGNELGRILSRLPRTRKEPVADLLRAILALVESAPEPDDTSALVPVTTAALERHLVGPACVRAAIDRGELRGVQGSRRRVSVYLDELIAWRDSRAVKPRPPRKSTPVAADADPLDALIADGSLVARGRR